MTTWPRPTREEQLAAYGRTIPDLVAPGLKVLLCGINPGLMSAAIGHHFGNPANRLWPALHLAGFTPRRLHPRESHELLSYGLGITNLVARATATAAELTAWAPPCTADVTRTAKYRTISPRAGVSTRASRRTRM